MATKFRIFCPPIIAKAVVVTLKTQAACVLYYYLTISEAINHPSAHHYCPPGYADHEHQEGTATGGILMIQHCSL